MQPYAPNSHKSKAEPAVPPAEKKKVEKVVKGKVTKKTNNARKLTDVFISEDIDNVKSYVLFDVIVPTIKRTISEIVSNGIEMILFGETRGSGKKHGNSHYVAYNSYSNNSRDRFERDSSRNRYSWDDIEVDSRAEAEEVLSHMQDIIDQYGQVTVLDMYDLVGVGGRSTDNNYGWMNIRNARVVRTRNGYRIEMPKALPID